MKLFRLLKEKITIMKLSNITNIILKILTFMQYLKFCLQRSAEKIQKMISITKDMLQKL